MTSVCSTGAAALQLSLIYTGEMASLFGNCDLDSEEKRAALIVASQVCTKAAAVVPPSFHLIVHYMFYADNLKPQSRFNSLDSNVEVDQTHASGNNTQHTYLDLGEGLRLRWLRRYSSKLRVLSPV